MTTMAANSPEKPAKRVAGNPTCDTCRHPLSFHSRRTDAKCKGLGCKCQGFVGQVDPRDLRE